MQKSINRNFRLGIFLSIGIVNVGIPSARADEPQNEKLRATLAAVKTSYPQFIHRTFEDLIQTQYLMKVEDYKSTVQYALEALRNSQTRIDSTQNQWKAIQTSINPASLDFYDSASEIDLAESVIRDESTRMQLIAQDLAILRDGWPHRCAADRLDRASQIYDPIRIFSFDHINFVPMQGPDFSIDFRMSVDTAGQFQVPKPETNGATKAADALPTVGMAAGAAIGAPFGGIGAPVGAAIGYVAGQLTRLLIIGFVDMARIRALNEQSDLLNQLYDFQKSTLKSESTTTRALIAKNCDLFLPEETTPFLQNASDIARAQADRSLQALVAVDSAKSDVWTKYDVLLKSMKETYYPTLERNYINEIHQRFSDLAKLDQEAIAFVSASIKPALHFAAAVPSPEQALLAKQDLWDQLIVGDASYRASPGFSFMSGDTLAGVAGFWDRMAPQLNQWIGK